MVRMRIIAEVDTSLGRSRFNQILRDTLLEDSSLGICVFVATEIVSEVEKTTIIDKRPLRDR